MPMLMKEKELIFEFNKDSKLIVSRSIWKCCSSHGDTK